ncbi:hypothetical protein ACFL7M_12560 [Thermodesulfobacteriota bacterium]
MIDQKDIPMIVREISLNGIQRVVAALEGDWNPTMVTVWTCNKGKFGFSKVTRTHSIYKPSLELYFENVWLGIHCFNRINGENVFDEKFALQILEYVEANYDSGR